MSVTAIDQVSDDEIAQTIASWYRKPFAAQGEYFRLQSDASEKAKHDAEQALFKEIQERSAAWDWARTNAAQLGFEPLNVVSQRHLKSPDCLVTFAEGDIELEVVELVDEHMRAGIGRCASYTDAETWRSNQPKSWTTSTLIFKVQELLNAKHGKKYARPVQGAAGRVLLIYADERDMPEVLMPEHSFTAASNFISAYFMMSRRPGIGCTVRQLYGPPLAELLSSNSVKECGL